MTMTTIDARCIASDAVDAIEGKLRSQGLGMTYASKSLEDVIYACICAHALPVPHDVRPEIKPKKSKPERWVLRCKDGTQFVFNYIGGLTCEGAGIKRRWHWTIVHKAAHATVFASEQAALDVLRRVRSAMGKEEYLPHQISLKASKGG